MRWFFLLPLITGSVILAWLAAIAAVVPLVLIVKFGRVELRSKEELRAQSLQERPAYRDYRSLQKWTDARGTQHDVDCIGLSPRQFALLWSILALFVVPFLPLSLVGGPAVVILRWESDRINHRLELRRKVRAVMRADAQQFDKLVAEARQELTKLGGEA